MESKCFCHFNDYEVKDAKARAAIESITFNSVEEMKSSNALKNGMIAKTNGYYEPGDHGGAEYLVKNSVPETYHEVLSGGLFAQLLHPDGVLNVNTYGAHGDGVSNDAVAIQRALCEADMTKIKTVYFPSNEYYVGSELELMRAYTVCCGCPSGTKIIATDYFEEGKSVFHVTNSGITIRDLFFEARYEVQWPSAPKMTAINFDMKTQPNTDGSVENCTFYRFGFGISVYGRNLNVKNCLFSSGCYGIKEKKVEGIENRDYVITGNRFHSVGNLAIYGFPRACIALTSYYEDEERAVIISDNFADYSTTFITGNINGCTITNNIIRYQDDGIFISSYSGSTAKVQYNRFHTLIANNTVEYYCAISESKDRMGDAPIELSGLHGVTIEGNTIIGARKMAIYAVNCGDIKIADNIFVNCPAVHGTGNSFIWITNKQGYVAVMNNIGTTELTDGIKNAQYGIWTNVSLDINVNNALPSRDGDHLA